MAKPPASAPPPRRRGRPAGSKNAATESNTADRRAEIVHAAAETFFERGYTATTVRDVADAVGILNGSLYYYISNKEDLLHAIVKSLLDRRSATLTRNQALEARPLAKIWLIIHDRVIDNVAMLPEAAVWFRDFGSLNQERQADFNLKARAHLDWILSLIEQARADGSARPDVDPPTLAMGAISMCNALTQWFRPGVWVEGDELARGYADMVVASIANSAADRASAKAEALDAVAAVS